jgi:HSP20 family protein
MNPLLQGSFVPSGGSRWYGDATGTSTWARPLPLDVYATPDEVVIIAAVAGMNPQDLEITFQQNTVTPSGSVPSAAESGQGQHQQANWYLRELWHGRFRGTVTLPFEIEAERAEASFENGIVRITLPKAGWTKPRKIAITAGSGQREAVGAGSPSSRPALP